jgi:hypothetical protein
MMSEHDHQVLVFDWKTLHETREPRLRKMHAIPNGGHRHKAVAAKMKAEGTLAGIPDIHLPYPAPNNTGVQNTITMLGIPLWLGLYIELKKLKCDGGKEPTAAQLDFLDYADLVGYKTAVCYGYQEAIAAIKEYLGMP